DVVALRIETRVMFGTLELPVLVLPMQRGVLVRTRERERVDLALRARQHGFGVLVDLHAVLRGDRIGLVLAAATRRRDELDRRRERGRRGGARGGQRAGAEQSGVPEEVAARNRGASGARIVVRLARVGTVGVRIVRA